MSETTTDKIEISIEEYNGLKSSSGENATLRSNLQEAQNKYASLATEHEELKSKKAPKEGPKREEIEAEVRREFGEKLQAAETSSKTLEKQLRQLTVTDRVMSAIQDRVVPSAQKWLRSEIEKECDIEGDFSSPVIVVKDEAGNVKWSAKRPDQKMNVEEYTEALESRYPEFFRSGARGSESNGNTTKTPLQTSTNSATLTFNDLEGMSNEEIAKIPPAQLDKILNNTTWR